MEENKILIIEDDPNIADVIEIHVKDLGYRLERAADGKTGLKKALSKEYALIILDLMLPELDGLEVCKRIRAEQKFTPILMLTAKSFELDKVLGLELGADDYITKPFSIRELIARIKAIFRRVEVDKEKNQVQAESTRLQYGDLFIDMEKHKVMVGDKIVDLTAKEFDLLTLFAKNPGRVYKRDHLLDLVWGYQYSGYDHTVNSHINRLRNKIEKDPANPRYIKTLWGVGYRFSEAEEFSQ
jgi:DNA-binding response OmpR family regulator